MTNSGHRWIPWRLAEEARPVRLFCFPFAGGGASVFRSWACDVAADVELMPVQLPGRETRFGEPLIDDLDGLVRATVDGIGDLLQPPFAFYGHSMGALLAFELSRHLRRQGRAPPGVLLVSGFRAPHLPDDSAPVHVLGDDKLVAEMRTLAGTPDAVLEDAELCSLLLPILRADFRICETYRHRDESPLSCPIVAFAGIDDAHASAEVAAGWSEHTTAEFTLQVLPGNHFFPLYTSRSAVLDEIRARCRELEESVPSPGATP